MPNISLRIFSKNINTIFEQIIFMFLYLILDKDFVLKSSFVCYVTGLTMARLGCASWYFNCSGARLTRVLLYKRHKLFLETRTILQRINCYSCPYLKVHSMPYKTCSTSSTAITLGPGRKRGL